ncbi:AAA-like domain-containing protein [Nodosilinea sp. LEGE 07298]|uniref:AAA-like domain-containing protein n=1 Tax=Nodosilinea sp. LEGE 07298 TaxID=2777970 RepID=UPI0018828939|nr:AAA-like domain-containing protein [Nodosilinea sp. LEGE 07298]MBE9110691.1 AAA-like domain-containing protein [Nodosilinea sp. LEGE 07298]
MLTQPLKSPYQVGGSLPPTAPTYVQRRADAILQQQLLEDHFCYVFNARQMGKSSLRVHTMAALSQLGVHSVAIDLTAIGSQHITVDQWYAAIAASLVRGLSLPIALSQWWRGQTHLPPVARLAALIDHVLLPGLAAPLVIFIDEIDSILGLAFPTDDFFALIRTCFNRRADNPAYQRLTFALFGVATPNDLMADKARTPFNIGQAIALEGFTLAEAQPLVESLQPWVSDPQPVLERVLHWTGGQPFLTQKLCHLIVSTVAIQTSAAAAPWVDQLVQSHLIDSWELHDEPEHLKTMRDRLWYQPQRLGQRLGLYQQVLDRGTVAVDNSLSQAELLLVGLVERRGGYLQVKNPIYRAVFSPAWVRQQLNDLRPYASALNAWVASGYTDESRLLRGQALHETLAWAEHQRLGSLDYRFLAASQALDQREALARVEADRLVEVEARLTVEHQRRLEQQRHLDHQRLLLGAMTMALVAATGLGFVARRQYRQATQNEAYAIVRSAEALHSSQQSFEALLEAIRGQQRLRQSPGSDLALQAQTNAILERIVLGIHQKNRLSGHRAAVLAVSFNPGPDRAGQLATAGVDATIHLWQPDGTLIATLVGHQATIRTLSYTPDGRYLASAGDDGTIRLWTAAGAPERIIQTSIRGIWSMAISPDGATLLVGGSGNQVEAFSLGGETVGRFQHPGEVTGIRAVAYSPKGDAITLGGNNNTISIWRPDGQYLDALNGHSAPVHTLAFNPAGDRLVSGSLDKTIKLWTLEGTLLKTLVHHKAPVKEIAFSPSGQEFVSASWDKTLALWSASGTLLTTLEGHSAAVWGVAYSPDGTTIASAGADNQVLLWQPHNPFYQKLQGLSSLALGAVFSPDGQTLATAGSNQYLTLISTANATVKSLEAHRAGITSLALHPTQPWLTSASEDATLKLWDFEGNLKQTIGDHDGALLGVAWHPSGEELVASTVTGQLYRWAADGSAIADWSGAPAPIWDVAYSPDGTQFATASNDGKLRLWSRSGDLLHTLEHGSAVWRVAYSADGSLLATGSGDNTARLWRPDGTLVTTLTGHQAAVWGVVFSPDGSLLATASIDETVKLWSLDCRAGQLCPRGVLPQPNTALIGTLKQHNSGVRSVAFNREGTVLASVGDDETVVFWNLEPILTLAPLSYGCDWVADYLRTNSTLKAGDRNLCQGLETGL